MKRITIDGKEYQRLEQGSGLGDWFCEAEKRWYALVKEPEPEPEPDLNALAATEIMGWHRGKDFDCWADKTGICVVEVDDWQPTENLGQAMQLVIELGEDGWAFGMDKTRAGTILISLAKGGERHLKWARNADDLSSAITQVCLQAKGAI